MPSLCLCLVLIWCLMRKKARRERSMAPNDGRDSSPATKNKPKETTKSPVCSRTSRSTGKPPNRLVPS